MARTTLEGLAKRLLENEDLEPADWLSDDADEDAGRFVPHADHGIAASRELIDYTKLAEDGTFRGEIASILHKGGFYWGIAPVRLPTKLMFALPAANVVAFLAGTSVLASDPDSGALLVASWNVGASTSTVASFLFDDVVPSDPTPGDFVVEALSIAEHLESYGDPEAHPESANREVRDLARLYRRGIWLAHVVQDDAVDSRDDLARTIRDASPLALYDTERAQFDTHPHLAAYWLLSHTLLGETNALVDALDQTSTSKSPVIVDLRKRLSQVAAEPTHLEQVFAQRTPRLKGSDLAELRRLAKAR
ncbi:hypothetical protein AKJ09_09794 [Labilithrix luteola]|uniref:Uncharacterized protein n=1 Tax=Labilithrix luteola TaxID=1391654 RepID=A0A0K1QBG8_9BACT|nr:hypothetical protein [Labilithrix luteola]AKV03131.1 hypothetical protein AKJ09_09794 [Labilithrix luteola]